MRAVDTRSRGWLVLAGLLGILPLSGSGCGGPPGGSSHGAGLPLSTCLPGWWENPASPGSCGTYYCAGASTTTPECGASDCEEIEATEYNTDHTTLDVIFTYSIKDGHLSADNWAISHGTWHLTSQGWLYNDSYVQNAMEETCTATDRVETAPGDKTPTDTVHRLAKNLADTLNGAAGSGQWQDVPVK